MNFWNSTTIKKETDRVLSLNTKFFVDIGASNVPAASQTESLLENGWSGIMFECDPVKYSGLSQRMSNKNVKVISDKVTPDNILDILKVNNAPNDFYLSLDIDSYDYFVLDKILSIYKPQLIISEINEKIPPPIKFSVIYNSNAKWWDGSHFYGYSISMLDELLDKYGYKIESLDYNNVILIPGKQIDSIENVYNNGYLNRPERHKEFYYNSDFESVYTLQVLDQIKFINDKFKNHIGEYIINK